MDRACSEIVNEATGEGLTIDVTEIVFRHFLFPRGTVCYCTVLIGFAQKSDFMRMVFCHQPLGYGEAIAVLKLCAKLEAFCP